MNVKKCDKGHFYNSDKYSECPHCKEKEKEKELLKEEEDSAPTWIYRPLEEPAKTIASETESVINQKKDRGLVVGWLVGISGIGYGKQYALYTTDNIIGSGKQNDIVILHDNYVMDNCHCMISFDIYNKNFVLNISQSNGDVYLNQLPANENVYLEHRDVLQVGGTCYMLVVLCRDGFSWWESAPVNEKETKEEKQSLDNIQEDYEKASGTTHGSKVSSGKNIIYNIDDLFMESQDLVMDANGGFRQIDMSEGETSVLVSSTWRCESCNALNSGMVTRCRICDSLKG